MENRWGNDKNRNRLYFLDFSKITVDGDSSHEIKRHLILGRKAMINLESILKSRDRTDAEAEALILWPPHAKN